MYSILTCADTKFYVLASILAKNIRLYNDCQLFLYDIGLRESEKKHLRNLGVTIEQTVYPQDTFAMNSQGNIRTVHKINCIRTFLEKYRRNVLVLDADVLLINNCVPEIFPQDDEIVVTYRCNRERKSHILMNGKINAGVMGFGKNIGRGDFFPLWDNICQAPEQTAQSALSLLLDSNIDCEAIGSVQKYNGYTVRILDGNIYNDVTCREGKIFHCKSAARRKNKYLEWYVFAFLQRHFPSMVDRLITFNRRHRLFVWGKAAKNNGC